MFQGVAGAFQINPFGVIDYHYMYLPSFVENGSDANLAVHQRTSNMLRTELGCTLTRKWVGKTSCFAPFISLSWVRKILLNGGIYNADFTIGRCLVRARTFHKPLDFISPSAGVRWSSRYGVSFVLSYRGEYNGNKGRVHEGNLKAAWAF